MQISPNRIWFPEQKVLLVFPVNYYTIVLDNPEPSLHELAQQASYIFRSADHYVFDLVKDRFGVKPLLDLEDVFTEYTMEYPEDSRPKIHVNPEEWTYYRLLCS